MAIRPDVVNLFYKWYISEEKHYAMAKGKKVYLGPDEINTLYSLDDNTIGHMIFKNSMKQDKEDVLKRVA